MQQIADNITLSLNKAKIRRGKSNLNTIKV